MTEPENRFVLGVDLDGCVADFTAALRPIAAKWLGVDVESLTPNPSYGFPEWGLTPGAYEDLHRWAVTQHNIFETVQPIANAGPALRRLGKHVRIRIITHRLYIKHVHRLAVEQTTCWLDRQGIPYWDLCFMKDKGAVGADLYIEDSPANVEALRAAGHPTIVFGNSTNKSLDNPRVESWPEVERVVMASVAAYVGQV